MNYDDTTRIVDVLYEIVEQLKPVEVSQEHFHQYTIPVEWGYEADENIGGDYAKAALVIKSKWVTKLRCVCGDEVDR